MKITVELENNRQLDKFIQLVNEFEKVNNHLKFKGLKVAFKYDMRSSGEFDDSKPNTISINPNRCDNTGEFSAYLICIHEWSHLLDKKCKMLNVYKKEFKNDKLILTRYAKEKGETEHLAEIISMYLTNPHLLKLISEKHFEFVSRFFKSPTPCTREYFLTLYERYSPRYKKMLERKYGVAINLLTTN